VGAAKTERNAEIIRLYFTQGWSQQRVADHFGLARETVKDIIASWRAKQGPVDKQEEIERAASLLDEMIVMAMELAAMEGAPVTAGKDGLVVVDPEQKNPEGGPMYVRDYSGRISAINTIKGLLERKAKLLGLDSATKVEQSGQVTYVLPGVAPETLQ
jgi:hypothetical protein